MPPYLVKKEAKVMKACKRAMLLGMIGSIALLRWTIALLILT